MKRYIFILVLIAISQQLCAQTAQTDRVTNTTAAKKAKPATTKKPAIKSHKKPVMKNIGEHVAKAVPHLMKDDPTPVVAHRDPIQPGNTFLQKILGASKGKEQ